MGEPDLEKSGSSAPESIGSRSELGEVNHLSTRRKRKKFDLLSSGERTGNSLNPGWLFLSRAGGRGTWHQLPETSRSVLESRSKEGERPVGESRGKGPGIPSTTGHEKSCGNLRGPSRKAKYSFATDSELVP